MRTWLPLTFLMLLSVASLTTATQSPSSDQSSGPPRFSLEIQLRQDAISADLEVPLEVTMTNTSNETIVYGLAFGQPTWVYFSDLDIRDNDGKRAELKPLMRQFELMPSGGPMLTLPAGEKLTVEILVNRAYNLSRPGKYTIQARMGYRPGMDIKSNIVTLTLQDSPHPTADRKPRFSITLTAPYNIVRAGYQVPVKIALKNTSKKKISLRSWQEFQGTSHEFSSGIQVRDPDGNPAPRVKAAQAFDDETRFPSGRYLFFSLNPGETYEETKIVGQLDDIAQPGTYTLQVEMFDPETNMIVTSNMTTVNVQSKESTAQIPAQPPFTLEIREGVPFSRSTGQGKHAVVLAITNRSDHTIDFDIGAGDNDLDAFNSHGNLAVLTKNGRLSRGRLRTAAKGGVPIQRLQPGETKSGGMLFLEDYYDVGRHGSYVVQMRGFDDESQSIVTSNRITVDIKK